MINRRDFLKLGAGAAAGIFIPIKLNGLQNSYLYIPASPDQVIIDPLSIDQYVEPLVIPPAMPRVSEITLPDGTLADYYEIAMRQFQQQILPSGLPATTVWSYGSANHSGTFNYPSFTIEAEVNKPVRVKWINDLVDEAGNFLQHLLPIDPTLHWANPTGPIDSEAHTVLYEGPVPMVVHVHGAHTFQDSDGYPEAWYLPNANNLSDYIHEGTFYAQFKDEFANRWGEIWEPGSATFQYPNDTRASTTWFHDHTLGITRLNVYAGPAGFFILRGGEYDLPPGELPGPAPALGDPAGLNYYEIPIAIQDRTFNADGSLFYPDTRAFFEEQEQLDIPFKPDGMACDGQLSDVPPIWNPEFFGNTMVVNGRTWPFLDVERRRYRLRLLNGCNSRFLILKLVTGDPAIPGEVVPQTFWVIGNEGGFLPSPVDVEELVMSPAERFDIIVDFSEYSNGTELFLINVGPDEPYGGGTPGVDFTPANPNTTGQVMKFNVVPIEDPDSSTAPADLALPQIPPVGPADRVRPLSLVELDSATVRVETTATTVILDCDDGEPFGPTEAHLGVVEPSGDVIDLGWDEPLTEAPVLNETEIWELYNFTADAHPIHVHMVHFEVIDRQAIELTEGGAVTLIGDPRPSDLWEKGLKDTVIALPGEVTRIKATFDLPGLFVWHCHILEHEDNEMMRPYQVVRKLYFPIINKA